MKITKKQFVMGVGLGLAAIAINQLLEKKGFGVTNLLGKAGL